MQPDETFESAGSAQTTRREFLAGSMASLALIAAGSKLSFAQPAEHGISDAVFDRAKGRAADLVRRMTVEEATQQLVNNVPALPSVGLARYNYWTEGLHGVAVDGPITSFPQPIALGCSWNTRIVDRVYSAVSDEARAYHNQTGRGLAFFSPSTVNMGLRDPRWGRANENFSEDPLLVRTMAVHVTRAMQGDHPSYLKTLSCAKHYICNDTDTDRNYADAAPDRRSFWEYYVRGFEGCVRDGHVFTVMSAYNSLWGIPCSASSFLLTDLLRKRWGFKGYVVSDCDAIADIYRTHHYVETPHEAAAVAIKAGSDLNCGRTYSQALMKAVNDKLVSEDDIRNALVRVLTGRVLLGEFDPPESVPWNKLTAQSLEDKGHRDLAREAARQTLVLLKNDGAMLPLNKAGLKRIALIGPMAMACHLGGYSGRSSCLVSPFAGIAEALGQSIYTGKIMAGNFLSTSDLRGPAVAYAENGDQFLTNIRNNDWAQYGPIDLSGKTSIALEYAADADGGIDIYLDDRTKAPLASIDTKATRSMTDWQTVSSPLPQTAGEHIVFIRFRSATPRAPFFNFKSFELGPAASAPQAAPRVAFAPGCSIVGPRNQALLDQAVKTAQNADVVLLFLGVNRLLSDESRDRFDIDLPDVQHELAAAVLAANPRTVLVVHSTVPVAIEAESKSMPAILCSLFAGEQQGNAIADALFGDFNPGGKLCSTWYRGVGQLPNFHDYDIKHGRTYMYFRGEPIYPFGYGLSYTTFAYANLQLGSNSLAEGKPLSVSVDVTNSGLRAGDEVVQLYVQVSGDDRPIKQLAAFERVSLAPGEKRTVTLSLPHDHIAFQFWDEAKQDYALARGAVKIMVGSSSADIRQQGQIALE